MQFVCRVGTSEGQVLEQVHTATDEPALRQDLEKRGLHIFEVRRRGLSLSLRSLWRRRKRMPMQKFMLFNQELAALLRSGLPLLQALDLMLERYEDRDYQPVLADIRDRVKSGQDLSEAFSAYGDLFPRLYPASLKAGERSGELENVIRRFIRYTKLMLDARKRVISSLIYPAVLITLSLTMILVLTVYVMPQFQDFYTALEGELPAITKITLGFSVFVRSHYVLLPLLLVGLVCAFLYWRGTDNGRLLIDRSKLKLPLLGPIFRRLALSEFTRSLATLVSGGIPLVPAFELASEAVGNASIRERLGPRIQMVREGQPFYDALEESGVFPDMSIDMIKVGEATGALDEMLLSVSDFFDEQVETQLQRILSLLEPIMLVFMGVIIALILVSLYLPMFSIIRSGNF
jgi:type IV pilus assembly protein PilC